MAIECKLLNLPRIRSVFLGGWDMVENRPIANEELDIEWLQLIKEAKKNGIQLDEIRKFFLNNKEMLAEGR